MFCDCDLLRWDTMAYITTFHISFSLFISKSREVVQEETKSQAIVRGQVTQQWALKATKSEQRKNGHKSLQRANNARMGIKAYKTRTTQE